MGEDWFTIQFTNTLWWVKAFAGTSISFTLSMMFEFCLNISAIGYFYLGSYYTSLKLGNCMSLALMMPHSIVNKSLVHNIRDFNFIFSADKIG